MGPEHLGDVLRYETQARRRGYQFILGLDEAGRGPLAGPVVAAAVMLKEFTFDAPVRDSKTLSASQRETAFHEISKKAAFGVGIVSETVIDEINILEATFVAMTNAVWQLMARLPKETVEAKAWRKKVFLLVDGNRFKSDLPFQHQTIVDGDVHSLSISCASVIAKVTRDRILAAYDQILPQYGFQQHKGYPTREHKQAIKKHGLSFIHRRTFRHAL